MGKIEDPKQLFTVVYPEKMRNHPDWGKDLNCCFQFEIDGPNGGIWCLNLKNGQRKIETGKSPEADCSIQISEENFKKLMRGELNPAMALMTRKIKVTGSMSAAMKLKDILG